MAAHVTKQATTRVRGSAVSADVPILASKITALAGTDNSRPGSATSKRMRSSKPRVDRAVR